MFEVAFIGMKRGVLFFVLLAAVMLVFFATSAPPVEAQSCTGECMWTGSSCMPQVDVDNCGTCHTAVASGCGGARTQIECSFQIASCTCNLDSCDNSNVNMEDCESCCGGTWLSFSSRFESGTSSLCCENDGGEYNIEDACCNDPFDCVDSGTCYSSGSRIQSNTLACQGNTWYVCDLSNLGNTVSSYCCVGSGSGTSWETSSEYKTEDVWGPNACGDGFDNDCDGQIDCADSDCEDYSGCCADTGDDCSTNSDCCDSGDLCMQTGAQKTCQDYQCPQCSPVGFSGTKYCCEDWVGNPSQQCNKLDSFQAI